MFTDHNKALSEFNRVLDVGGKLVISANGLGYFLMYLTNGIKYRSIGDIGYGFKGIFDTIYKKLNGKNIGSSAVNFNEMKTLLDKYNFELIECRLWLPHEFYSVEKFCIPSNYVFIAIKKE